MYRRYQEAQSDPALAGALDQIRVTPSGDRLKIDAPVSQDQLLTLIRSDDVSRPDVRMAEANRRIRNVWDADGNFSQRC